MNYHCAKFYTNISTNMDTIYIYIYITMHVYVPHFYDLSTLVGCWSPVYKRRIIYTFLNVCPFYYTAFVVSGKVGYP